ncbi:MAG: tripartite tricarboxylate transporter permease [Pseudomonadota bacterium]|nr:tripartite tricarboxylate transporter permease [Pseudomonadota bacterium]
MEMEYDLAFLGEMFVRTFTLWWVIVPAIFLGLVVGAIPGFSAANTIIILLPLTLAMDPEIGLTFMVALYASSRMGAGIPAILVNIPGTAGAAATPLDGYPMTKRGEGQQALAMSFTASIAGGLLTTFIALFALPWLSQIAYFLHSVEMIVIMFFGISLIATIAAKDTMKGLIAGFFGLMIGFIGTDVVYETPRGTFGFLELYDKIPLIPALVGLFAVSEAFTVIENRSIVSEDINLSSKKITSWRQTFNGVRIAILKWWHVTWNSLIGLVIGVVPGAGAAIASFVAYQQSKTFSKTPELYGTGHVEGLIAPESANNGVTSGTLVPLLVIGIPGGATAAIMLVVLQYHGVTVGPDLFMTSPELAFGPFTAMAATYALMILMVLPLARYMSNITVVSTVYMVPTIIAFTLVGSFVPRAYLFDMNLALVFGIIGYVARKTGYHVAAILIGIILGPLMETYFLRAMRMSEGDVMVIFSSTIGNTLWVLLVISMVLPYVIDKRRKNINTNAAND